MKTNFRTGYGGILATELEGHMWSVELVAYMFRAKEGRIGRTILFTQDQYVSFMRSMILQERTTITHRNIDLIREWEDVAYGCFNGQGSGIW